MIMLAARFTYYLYAAMLAARFTYYLYAAMLAHIIIQTRRITEQRGVQMQVP